MTDDEWIAQTLPPMLKHIELAKARHTEPARVQIFSASSRGIHWALSIVRGITSPILYRHTELPHRLLGNATLARMALLQRAVTGHERISQN